MPQPLLARDRRPILLLLETAGHDDLYARVCAGANGGAGGARDGVRAERGGGGRHGAAGGVHVLHRRRDHGPQPRARRGGGRILLERPRLLQENKGGCLVTFTHH